MRITNNSDIGLPLAVWLLQDNYDYINEANYISVTSLMKPLRQIILPSRVVGEAQAPDVGDFIARTLGNAIHDGIEKAWTNNPYKALKLLGIPDAVAERIKVNPTLEEIRASNEIIPVYIEQRAFREFGGRKIGGKFDLVADGIVQDNKSTSAYSWLAGTRDDEHQLQLSLYRWLDAVQDHRKITEDYGIINYIFTDWSKMMAKTNPKYPQKRVEEKRIPLLSVAETEQWIRSKLALIDKWHDADESDIPHCTDEELWRSDPVHKYYGDPSKTDGRATKNFDSLSEANRHLAEKGKGIVITKPGEAKRCNHCNAFEACTQKDAFQ